MITKDVLGGDVLTKNVRQRYQRGHEQTTTRTACSNQRLRVVPMDFFYCSRGEHLPVETRCDTSVIFGTEISPGPPVHHSESSWKMNIVLPDRNFSSQTAEIGLKHKRWPSTNRHPRQVPLRATSAVASNFAQVPATQRARLPARSHDEIVWDSEYLPGWDYSACHFLLSHASLGLATDGAPLRWTESDSRG